MNERILLNLFVRSGLEAYIPVEHFGDQIKVQKHIEKFAELIVRECSVYCQGHILPKGIAEENDLNYNDGIMDCAIGLKQHFGVE
jgi:hypothetical protein